jgi:hypothetical protein
MRPRDLLKRAKLIAAEREALANVVDMTAVKAWLLQGFDLNQIPMPLRREFLMRGMTIQYVDPDGTVVERVSPDEHFARRDKNDNVTEAKRKLLRGLVPENEIKDDDDIIDDGD